MGSAQAIAEERKMSHITNKVRIEKEKNNRNRGFNGFDTGTRDMGYKSNQDRKEKAKLESENFKNKKWTDCP